LNKLLERQLKRNNVSFIELPENIQKFIKDVSLSYDHHELDRSLIERSIDLSSQELTEANKKLRLEAGRQKVVLENLKSAILSLPEHNENLFPSNNIEDEDLISISDYLANEIQKRKEAENKSKLYERAINSSSNGIIITDPNLADNPMIFCNPAFLEVTGYTLDEVIGKNCRFLQGAEKEQEALLTLRTAIKEKKSCSVTLKNYRKDGNPFWNELKISPIFNASGEITNFIGIQSDITEQINTANQIHESNARITELLQNISSGILVEDEQRRIALVNSEFCRLFKIPASPENLIGVDCSQSAEMSKSLFENPELFVKRIDEILKDKILVKAEELKLADGSVFERDYVPIFVNDVYSGHLWSYRDITARKHSENTLLQERQLLKTIIDNIPEPIYVKDTQGRKILVNRAEVRILGQHDEKEVIGFDDSKFYSPDLVAKTKMEDSKIISSGIPILNEESILTPKEGKIEWVIGSRVPYKDRKGNVIGIVGISYKITERKIIEEALKESEAKYKSVVNSINQVIFQIDQKARWVFLNNAWTSITGFSVEESLGKNMMEFIYDGNRKKNFQFFRPLMKREIKYHRSELQCITKDGDLKWIEVVGRLSTDKDERITGAYGTLTDITERRRIEQELKDLKTFYEQTLNDLPGQIAVFDTEYKYLYVNPSSITNKEIREWIIGKDDYDYCRYRNLDISIADGRRKRFEQVKKDKHPIKFDEIIIKPDQSKLYFERNITPILNENGEIKQYLAYGIDLTNRKNTELELLTIKNQLESILNTIGEGIITIDQSGTIVLVNDEIEKIFGWNRNDLLKQNIKVLMPEKHREHHSEGMKRYLLTRESKILGSTISIEGMKKDGAMFPMQIRIKETIIGEQLFFTAAINDITELNRLINDLETSNKALSDFAYIASHDLREPLRKISSFGSLLSKSLSEKLDADDKENLDYMIEGAKRMQQMVDDLLYYSRITTKAKTYSLIDLDELLKEIIKFELAQIIEDNNVKIIVENKLGTIKGEKTQIKQLFQNLIANGIKYRNKVIDPIIKIRSERSPLGIETQIEDNGIGIDEKYKDQVFEMFKRLHSKGEYEGSGIGLAVCKKIIELYNGEIKLNSEPGKGSTFIFRLPVKE
jgi:PAS domain S-box-containing protein